MHVQLEGIISKSDPRIDVIDFMIRSASQQRGIRVHSRARTTDRYRMVRQRTKLHDISTSVGENIIRAGHGVVDTFGLRRVEAEHLTAKQVRDNDEQQFIQVLIESIRDDVGPDAGTNSVFKSVDTGRLFLDPITKQLNLEDEEANRIKDLEDEFSRVRQGTLVSSAHHVSVEISDEVYDRSRQDCSRGIIQSWR